MLSSLTISNFIIFEHTEIQFNNNLNIITGASGAGKSIIMDALILLLGNRAEQNYSKDPQKPVIIEAKFKPIANQNKIQEILTEIDLEIEDELVIRREIKPSKKNRILLNQTAISLQVLKQITPLLIDLHQQFDHVLMTEEDFQRNYLDQFATISLTNYTNFYKEYKKQEILVKTLREQKLNLEKEQNYLEFQCQEIEQLQLKPNLIEDKEQELKILENASSIIQISQQINLLINENDPSLLKLLKLVLNQTQQLTKMLPSKIDLQNRLNGIYEELKDLCNEFSDIETQIATNEEKTIQIKDFLDKAFNLYKKHQVNTSQNLIDILFQLNAKLASIENIAENLTQAELKLKTLKTNLLAQAQTISELRKKAIEELEPQAQKLLQDIGMHKAILKIKAQTTDLTEYGIDKIEFLFDSNDTGSLDLLKNIASGGELSRLMLCLKTLLSYKVTLNTLIFDEIDSGVSGEAAKKIAQLIKKIAQNTQLIVITHLPQIASLGHYHLKVHKFDTPQGVKSHVVSLDKNQRVQELAEIIDGHNPSEKCFKSCKRTH